MKIEALELKRTKEGYIGGLEKRKGKTESDIIILYSPQMKEII